MKQAILAIILLGIFGILLSGGFSLKDPKGLLSDTQSIAKVEDGNPSSGDKTLQLINRPVTIIPPNSQTCSSPIAVDLLLDVSGSMCAPYHDEASCKSHSDSKINILRTAVSQFGTAFKPGIDLVGIQVFSSSTAESGDLPSMCNTLAACPILPLELFNSNSYTQAVSQLNAGGNTHMRDGFVEAKKAIEAKRNLPEYKDRKWALVFLSDGIPNDATPRSGPDETQNPTLIRDEIKAMGDSGVRIISVGLDLDAIIQGATPNFFTRPISEIPGYARDLIISLATPKTETGGVENSHIVDDARQLPDIYSQIAEKICNP